ncbi:hypothetical protein CesoFtcFv8_021874 [Champsocephalus esox]|uniref:Uncharacterized protein n=1 Tax=Champsocephalus esox TaxID=159716 RepID=A0AAN8B9B7_9TELE|nr:hypothetical protein CesoFtcFv8_021874 [Champsocephalus esox]
MLSLKKAKMLSSQLRKVSLFPPKLLLSLNEEALLKRASEVQEVPLVSATNTLKRVGKGKQAAEEPEAEEKSEEEPAPVRKSRGAKKEVAQAVPVKKARRGAAPTLEETSEESTVSEPAPAPVELVKKGEAGSSKARHSDQRARKSH